MSVSWTTVAPTAITGVVGLAGIGGSILSAKLAGRTATANVLLSINAEDVRAKVNEKRRIYATALASFNEMGTAATLARTFYSQDSQDALLANTTREHAAAAAMWLSVNELRITASPGTVETAEDLARTFAEYVQATYKGENKPSNMDASKALSSVVRAMRADLEEPP
jgi:hypothetical protein